MSKRTLQRSSLLALAGAFVALALAAPSFASESDPSLQRYGYTGRYLVIYEERRGKPTRIKTFDPLTLQKKVVFTARRSTDYIDELVASIGGISLIVVRERAVRNGGRRMNSTTQKLITIKDDSGAPVVVKTFKSLTGMKRFCGSLPYNMFLADTGANYVVEHTEGKIASSGKKCVATKRKLVRRKYLLRFDNPTAAPVVRRLKDDDGLPSFGGWPQSTAPDGSGYAFMKRSKIVYQDMATGFRRVLSPLPGRYFEEFMVGPGKRMVVSERMDSGNNDIRFLLIPNVDNPDNRIELTEIKSEYLAGRFCGDRPILVDRATSRYYLFDDQGQASPPVYTTRPETTSTSVGCTATSLVLAVEQQDGRGTLTWDFAALSP